MLAYSRLKFIEFLYFYWQLCVFLSFKWKLLAIVSSRLDDHLKTLCYLDEVLFTRIKCEGSCNSNTSYKPSMVKTLEIQPTMYTLWLNRLWPNKKKKTSLMTTMPLMFSYVYSRMCKSVFKENHLKLFCHFHSFYVHMFCFVF